MDAQLDPVCHYGGQGIAIIVDHGYNLWFKGTDVATRTPYARPTKAVRVHVHSQDQRLYKNLSVLYSFHLKGVPKTTIFINELGVYSLMFSSQTPARRDFRQWMINVLLPTLRDDRKRRLQLENDQLKLEDGQLRLDNDQLKLENAQLKLKNDQLTLDDAQLRLEDAQLKLKDAQWRLENAQLKRIDKLLRHRLAQIQPDGLIKPTDTSGLYQFVLLRLHKDNSSLYYAIRAPKHLMRGKMLEMKRTHPMCHWIYQIPYIPNRINFYTRMKEQLQIEPNGKEFTSHYDSEAELIAAIDVLKNNL